MIGLNDAADLLEGIEQSYNPDKTWRSSEKYKEVDVVRTYEKMSARDFHANAFYSGLLCVLVEFGIYSERIVCIPTFITWCSSDNFIFVRTIIAAHTNALGQSEAWKNI